MNVEFFHIADEAIISREGKLSAIGIFDHIWTESIPVLHPKLALLARLSCHVHEGSDHSIRVDLVDADGNILWESPDASVQLLPRGPGYPMTGNVAISVSLIAFPGFGDYAFKLIIDGNPTGTAPLTVRPIAERDS